MLLLVVVVVDILKILVDFPIVIESGKKKLGNRYEDFG